MLKANFMLTGDLKDLFMNQKVLSHTGTQKFKSLDTVEHFRRQDQAPDTRKSDWDICNMTFNVSIVESRYEIRGLKVTFFNNIFLPSFARLRWWRRQSMTILYNVITATIGTVNISIL
jgi:hypothetical protein